MIEQLLPRIKDPAEYRVALSLYTATVPLDVESLTSLLRICEKYIEDNIEQTLLCVGLAVDLLPRLINEHPISLDFAPLGLEDRSITALLTATKIIVGEGHLDEETTPLVVDMVGDTDISIPIRVMMARAALDILTASKDYVKFRPAISMLAEFLMGCDDALVYQATIMIEEVKIKCRK